ncbi:MAG: dienelactone hydrolase family protein [Lewinella sp.]|nr:dienelactone hydrolase family protein [Lewinella sp.]
MNYLVLSSSVALLLMAGKQIDSGRQTTYEMPAQPVMCHTDYPDGSMNAFANDPAFWALHPSPLPLAYKAMGEEVRFATPDGKDAGAYFIKAKKKSKKWLFVYQEWWGLNDYIRREADTFYGDLNGEVNVLALDMYDGRSTTNPQEAGQIMSSVKQERLESIINGASAFAGKKAKIANVGWCFGGGLSLQSALLNGKKSIGAVMYYGMPVRDIERLKTLKCDVLGLFATEERISKQVIEEFAANMKTAGKKLEYRIFNGVHGFANPSNPKHDPELTKEAYALAIAYLKGKFKVG